MTRIALHTFIYNNYPARVSTVQLGDDLYETIVMYDDGVEIEVLHTSTLENAKATHNCLMNKYNDLCYRGSIAELLGVANLGQFMHTVQAC